MSPDKKPLGDEFSVDLSEFDTTATDNLICPYCGFEDLDSFEISHDYKDYECIECKKHFAFDTESTRVFSSRKVPCLNGDEHKFGEWVDYGPMSHRDCKVCRKMESKINE